MDDGIFMGELIGEIGSLWLERRIIGNLYFLLKCEDEFILWGDLFLEGFDFLLLGLDEEFLMIKGRLVFMELILEVMGDILLLFHLGKQWLLIFLDDHCYLCLLLFEDPDQLIMRYLQISILDL